jgi:sugar lactone lactonase YvrE
MRASVARQTRRSVLAVALWLAAGAASAQTISTVAGSSFEDCGNGNGDGGPATSAQMSQPTAVATNSSGTIFIADQLCNTIRQVTTGGTISTIAGTANFSGGFGGDGGLATAATFDALASVAVDTSGRIYVADKGNGRIRLFTPGGDISTIAGGGTQPGSDMLGDGGAATGARLAFPQGVAVDSAGNVYVADTFDSLVRVFTIGGTISVAAGTPGSSGFGGDGGPATAALLSSPAGVAVDNAGHIFVADNTANVVRMFTLGGPITTIAGTPNQTGYGGDGGPATSALLSEPAGVSVDSAGNLYIADTGNGVIRRVTPGGVITTMAGGGRNPGSDSLGDGGPAPLAILSSPGGVTAEGNGNILVADTGDNVIRSFSATVPAQVLVASVLPGARSVLNTNTATIFAVVENAGASALSGCRISLPSPTLPLLQLDYQATNPATNALIGQENTSVPIAGGGLQTFLVSFSLQENTDQLVSLPGQQLLFSCDNVDPAATTQAVNTVDLSFSPTPVADVIALAAVSTSNGILEFPSAGAGAFAVASINVGSADTLTVSVDTGAAKLPLNLTICATNASAQCLAAPTTNSVMQSFPAGSTPTFSIFATATAPVAFAPGTNRIFVRFEDSAGASHGSTSVAVETN